jgi:hypothetical protein
VQGLSQANKCVYVCRAYRKLTSVCMCAGLIASLGGTLRATLYIQGSNACGTGIWMSCDKCIYALKNARASNRYVCCACVYVNVHEWHIQV